MNRRQDDPLAASLRVKAIAGASKSAIAGWQGDLLRVRIAAPAERGRANKALQALIADELGLPASRVRLVSGHTSARKTLEIEGLDATQVGRLLGRPDPE